MSRRLLLCWCFLQACVVVSGQLYCSRNCTCSLPDDTTSAVWPDIVAGVIGLAAPVIVGGLGYRLLKAFSKSSGSFDVPHRYPLKHDRMRDFDRKSLSSAETISGHGYDTYRRPQHTMNTFDDSLDLTRYPHPPFAGSDVPSWSIIPRDAPMKRPSLL